MHVCRELLPLNILQKLEENSILRRHQSVCKVAQNQQIYTSVLPNPDPKVKDQSFFTHATQRFGSPQNIPNSKIKANRRNTNKTSVFTQKKYTTTHFQRVTK